METTQVQYPAWQEVIRKAQAEHRARRAENDAKRAAEEHQWKLADIEETRQVLIRHGLNLPESTTGVWVVGTYTFQKNIRREYDSYPDIYLAVSKDVPDVDSELLEETDDDICYRTQCIVEIYWHDVSGASIADAIDAVDQKVGEQIAINRNVLARMENYHPEPQPETLPKPTLVEQLAALLREMVQEEVSEAIHRNEY